MEILNHYLSVQTTMLSIGDYQMSYLEFVGTIFNILSVRLIAKNKIINRPMGIIGTVLYIFLFYQIQLYSDLIEQVYFLATGFYGWRVWTSIGVSTANSKKDIQKVPNSQRINIALILLVGTGLLAYITSNLNIRLPTYFTEPASFVFLDAFTTILSFIATILLVQKKLEAWYLRILVDIIGIWLYYVKGVQFIAAEYVLFLILATSGLMQRIKLYKKQNPIVTVSS